MTRASRPVKPKAVKAWVWADEFGIIDTNTIAAIGPQSRRLTNSWKRSGWIRVEIRPLRPAARKRRKRG